MRKTTLVVFGFLATAQLMLAAGCGHNDILLRCREDYFNTIKNFVEMVKRVRKKASMKGGFDRRYPRR